MPTPIELRFPPLEILEAPEIVSWDWLNEKIGRRLNQGPGVSICIVSERGAPNRGGYFFHLARVSGCISFSTFDRENVISFTDTGKCAAFINHVTGRKYDEEMWKECQRLNLKADM